MRACGKIKTEIHKCQSARNLQLARVITVYTSITAMNRTEKHLHFHLEMSRNTVNRHDVEIFSDGQFSCTLRCYHPHDYTQSIHLWFDSMTAPKLIKRFGIRNISHLELLTPEHLQLVFDAHHCGYLFVNAAQGSQLMECRWKTAGCTGMSREVF